MAKEIVENLDEAFSGVEGGKDNIIADPAIEKPVEKSEEKNWADLGIDRYDGLSREQIAREILHDRQVSGRQGGELGDLRKERDALQEKISQIGNVTNPEKKAVEKEVAQMDEYELERFFAEINKDPRKAISGLLKGHMGVVDKESIEKMIGEAIDQSFNSYDKYNQTKSVQRSRPEHVEHEEYIEFISKPEYLGDKRSYEDKLEFAILHKENKELADVVYDLLARTNMSFADAREYGELRMQSKGVSEADKDKLRETIKKVGPATPGGPKPVKVSQEEKIETMDDAFGPDVE